MVTYNLTEIMKDIIVSTANITTPKIHLRLNQEKDAKFVTKYDRTFGRCFSVQLEPQVTALEVLKVEFIANLNIYIYLHHPGQ